MSWLPAAIASFTARGASCGRGREPARQDLRGLAGRERQRPPRRPSSLRTPPPSRLARLGGGRGRGDLAEQAAGAGVGRRGDGDVPDAPCVLGGAALPVVDVDVAAR